MLIKPSRRSRRAAAGTATAAILLGLGALLPGDLVPGAAGGGAEAPSYVSLGDSLAAGSQPDGDGDDGPTRQGYADVIGRRLGKVYPGLRTVRLGRLPAARGPTPARAAERYLARHPNVPLVTVDIGDNDVEGCIGVNPPSV